MEIATAYAGGCWFSGYVAQKAQKSRREPCHDQGIPFISELAAIYAAIGDARSFFHPHRGCADALDAWHAQISADHSVCSTKTNMTTASNEVAPALALELIVNDWTAAGACVNPEIVTIEGMPDKGSCVIEIGVTPERKVVARGVFKLNSKTEDTAVLGVLACNGVLYETRAEAILVVLRRAAVFFQKNKKAVAALEAYHAAMKAGQGTASALAPAEEAAPVAAPLPKGRFAEIPVAAISPNPENHRKFHDAIKAKELVDSIRQTGLLQPIAVRLLAADELGEMPMGGEGVAAQRYEIILGERRWRAHVTLGRTEIEAKVYEGVSRADAKAAALVENLQRQDVNAIEEAEGYLDLMNTKGYTQEQVARAVGRSRPVVANALRVLAIPAEVVDLIRENKLTMAHGLALHRYADRPEIVKVMAEQCVLHKTSAGQLEDWNKANYVPFYNELERAGIISVFGKHDLPGGYAADWPEAWATDADYVQLNSYTWMCWVPAKAREFLDAWRAEVKAAQEKEAAKREQAKKKHGIKSLQDLGRGEYEIVNTTQTEIADLLPENKVLTVKSDQGKEAETVTVCIAPKFAEAVAEALEAAKRADREAKLPVLLAEARAKVKKWKKLGADELAIVLMIALTTDSEDGAPYVSPASAKSQGVTIPAALKLDEYNEYRRTPADQTKAIKALAADPVAYARVMVDEFLVLQFCDSYDWERLEEPAEWDFKAISERGRALLSAVLGQPLGLLEDTAAGRRKLVAQVKALPWYATAYEQASKAGEDMGEIEEAAPAAAEGGEDDGDE